MSESSPTSAFSFEGGNFFLFVFCIVVFLYMCHEKLDRSLGGRFFSDFFQIVKTP